MATKAKNFVANDMTAVTPYLYVDDAAAAIRFYESVIGATTRFKMEGDGKVMHAELMVNGALFMLGEANPDMRMASPKTVGGTASGVFVYVPDVDATFKAALAAGASELRPAEDMFWGDRTASVIDPFGHHWTIATHVEDVSPDEIERRMADWKNSAGVN